MIAHTNTFADSHQNITTHNFWVRFVPPVSKVSAIFGEIRNQSSKNDFLLGVSCEVSKKAQIHLSQKENSVVKMIHQKFVKIPAKSSFAFKKGAYHIMLMGLKRKLTEKEQISCSFSFQNAGEVSLQIPVKKQ